MNPQTGAAACSAPRRSPSRRTRTLRVGAVGGGTEAARCRATALDFLARSAVQASGPGIDWRPCTELEGAVQGRHLYVRSPLLHRTVDLP